MSVSNCACTLPELLATTPALLEQLLSSESAGLIKVLRLVSKELCVIAMTMVRHLSVELGKGRYHSLKQIALLLRPALLHHLTITFLTTAGKRWTFFVPVIILEGKGHTPPFSAEKRLATCSGVPCSVHSRKFCRCNIKLCVFLSCK